MVWIFVVSMLSEILTYVIIGLVYFCVLIIVFAPTLYVGWFYVVSKKVDINRTGMRKITISVISINIILVLVAFQLVFRHLLPSAVKARNDMAKELVTKAIDFQEQYYAKFGRYYSLGPVRGPYKDEHGLVVGKDMVAEVIIHWDNFQGKHVYSIHSLHVWGDMLVTKTVDGQLIESGTNIEPGSAIRDRLLRSTR